MHLFISYASALGGAERVLVEFADGLERECWLACPPGALADEAAARGIRALPLAPRSLSLRGGVRSRALALTRLAGHAHEVRALVAALCPELVVASGMRPMLAAWLAGVPRQAPVVFLHHDLLPGPAIAKLVRSAAADAARVVATSQAVATDLDPHRRMGERIVVVHPGVDVDAFATVDRRPASPPEVLVLGAIEPWKRPDLALEALALARAQRPELALRLRVVGAPLGDGGARLAARLRARASDPDLAGTVELVGPIADPKPELERASCLLHCAPREPFGLALVESLAAGRPVVAPDAAGPREIVDGSCGILYPPGDAGAAARAVLSVLQSPERAARMGAAGRAVARERFDLGEARSRFGAAVTTVVRGGRAMAQLDAGTIALVTVTHNSAAELDTLLASVARHLPGAHVVVVDNASSDRTLEVARSARTGLAVEVIALERNVGFGAACNVGLRAVGESVVALVNPDAELVDGSLLGLADEVRRGPERLLAPLVLSPDGSRQDTAHPLPGSAGAIAQSLIPAALAGPAAAALGLAPWRAQGPRRVGWAVGCALVARTELLVTLGPFDERIFLYGEDLDLALRAREAGVETWFWPRARVVHAGAHSTAPAFGGEPFELLARARHDVVARRMGARRARLDDVVQTITFSSRIVLKRALGRATARERRQLAAIRSVRRSR